jgi:hypothetical protein
MSHMWANRRSRYCTRPDLHGCVFFHIYAFCVKFRICGFGHSSASFRMTAGCRDD